MPGFPGITRLPRDSGRARRNADRLRSSSLLFGDGFTYDSTGKLTIDTQSPIFVDSSGVGLNYGNGLTLSGSDLVAVVQTPIFLDGSGVGLNYGNGLTLSGSDLVANAQTPIFVDGSGIGLNYSTGLTLSGSDLVPQVESSQGIQVGASGLALDISNMTVDASPDTAADYVATYDADGATHKKVLLEDIASGGVTSVTATAPVTSTEGTTPNIGLNYSYGLELDGADLETVAGRALTISSTNFTISPGDDTTLLITVANNETFYFSDATTAIDETGVKTGQRLDIVIVSCPGDCGITIRDNANTDMNGDWTRNSDPDSVNGAWISFVFDGSVWKEVGRNDGIGNTITGTNAHAEGTSTVAGGAHSHAEGYQTETPAGQASHAEGWLSQASGNWAHAGGRDGLAYLASMFVQGMTRRSALGDRQFGYVPMKITTTNATPTELRADQSSYLTLHDSRVYGFMVMTVGFDPSDANYSVGGLFLDFVLIGRKSTGNDVTVIAQTQLAAIGSNGGSPPAGWATTIAADDAHDALSISVTGTAATTVYWLANVWLLEIG